MLRKLRSDNKKGFTLIELMIVIAIIGILAAIAIPNFIAYRNKAYCSRAESDAANVLAGIACYFAEPENRRVPDWSNLVADPICNVELNKYGEEEDEKNLATIYYRSGSGWAGAGTRVIADDLAIAVQVTDGSSLCPRADGDKLYTVYLGTEVMGTWQTELE